MKERSSLKKYSYVDSSGKEVSPAHLYIDINTGIFYVRVYSAGTVRTRSLKTKSFTTAKMRVSGIIKQIITTKKRSSTGKLVRDYYEDFLKQVETEDLSVATLTSYRTSWVHHIEPFWGNLVDTDINQNAYSEFLVWHKKKKGGKLFNPLKLLRKLLSFMRRSGAVFDLTEIKLPKKESDQNKEMKGTYIERDEYEAILKTKYMQGYVGLMVRMSYTLGFRIGELTNLKTERLKQFSNQTVVEFEGEDTKTRKARSVPLTKDLSDLLSVHRERTKLLKSDYVFPSLKNHAKPISKQAVDRVWIKAKNAAGIRRRIRYHDLRHTAATNMAELGIDPVKACALLGMSLKIYTTVYVKPQSLNLSSVVDLLSKGGSR